MSLIESTVSVALDYGNVYPRGFSNEEAELRRLIRKKIGTSEFKLLYVKRVEGGMGCDNYLVCRVDCRIRREVPCLDPYVEYVSMEGSVT